MYQVNCLQAIPITNKYIPLTADTDVYRVLLLHVIVMCIKQNIITCSLYTPEEK